MKYVVLGVMGLLLFAAAGSADNWPMWRGANGDGVSKETDLPLKWDQNDNVRWKIKLPERGNSTPVIWGERIFVTQAIEKKNLRTLMCLRRKDGELLWQRDVEYKDKERTHETNPYCSASPATDGERVVVSYGSAGVYCYDVDGKELWHRDLGKFDQIWGNASSPVIWNDLVFLNCGPGERTFLLAMNKKDGKDAWKVEIPGGKDGSKGGNDWIGSWSTPVVASIKGREELIMSWPEEVRAYNPKTGDVLWTCKGLTKLAYTSPLVTPEVVVAMSGFGGSAIAVPPGGSGDVTDKRLWRAEKNQQRIGSGVIIGEHVYMVNEPGQMMCIEWKTGKLLWQERLSEKPVWGSLVHAGERLYVTNTDGETFVVAAKPKFEVLARNPLPKETTRASIGVSDGELFIRTYEHLWCIGKKP
jgi:outer membrane protein assembly factor BamB